MTFTKPSKLTIILSAIVIFLVIVSINQCNRLKTKEKRLEVATQNIAALQDTIRLTKTNDGKVEADKLAFLTDKVSNLEKLSTDLANEVRNTKGKVSTIISGGVKLVHDTVDLTVKTTIKDSNIVSNFNYDTVYSKGNSRLLQGYTTHNLKDGTSSGKLTKDSIEVSFVTGIKNLDKGKPEIFLRSNYPGFSATQIDGAVLDPKLFQPKNQQKLITFGANIGYVPITYDFINKKTDVNLTRIGVSAGININLLKLLTHK